MDSEGELNLAAVIEHKHAPLKIITRQVPKPGADEILVRNHAIAGNPVDWVIQDAGIFIEKYPVVVGSDVAGVVVSVGSDVHHVKPGDRVIGFAGVIYNSNIDHGAWQNYTLLKELSTTKLPETLSFEEGSVFPMAVATSAMGLFVNLGIPRTAHANTDSEALLVWGAASSVGSTVVQIANAFGWKVFATASSKHHQWIRKLGATEVFDYNDADVIENVVRAIKKSGATLRRAYDAISKGSTFDQVPAILNSTSVSGGSIAIVLPWPEDKGKPAGIEISPVLAFSHATEHSQIGRWLFNEWLESAIQTGTIVPAPTPEVIPGGIHATQAAFDKMRAGVSGKKIVVQVP